MLPRIKTEAQFDAFVDDDRNVSAVLEKLGELTGQKLTRPKRGSAIVGISSASVVKMMAPHDRSYSEIERLCLQALEGQLPVPTPILERSGDFEGWPYLQMSRLAGKELVEVWPQLSEGERISLATQVGELCSALHDVKAPEGISRVDWEDWCAQRLATCESMQLQKGAKPHRVAGLSAFLSQNDISRGRVGLLHTEMMLEHLLVTQNDSGWKLSGLFDFEPAWVAPVHYEYASVGLFISQGCPEILKEILRAAGESISPERLFAMAMLHRYANLKWYLERLGGVETKSFAELAHRWFSS